MPKKFPKILTIIFLTYFSLQLASFLFLAPQPARAVNDSMPKLQVPIPDVSLPGEFLKFSKMTCTGEGKNKTCSIPWIAEYIAAVYKYAIGIVGILATVVMMVGGIIWLTAGGNATRVGEAKSWIGASLTGLVIALSSYMILYQINPDLIKLKPITIGVVEEIEGPEGDKELKKRQTTEYIIIHATGSSKSTVENVREYHKSLGWADIGYNFMIGGGGNWEAGRGEEYVGAHAENYNSKSIGIAYAGCDNAESGQKKTTAVSNGTITSSQYETLLSQTRSLMSKYGIPKDKVIGHSEAGASKACPCIDMSEFRSQL